SARHRPVDREAVAGPQPSSSRWPSHFAPRPAVLRWDRVPGRQSNRLQVEPRSAPRGLAGTVEAAAGFGQSISLNSTETTHGLAGLNCGADANPLSLRCRNHSSKTIITSAIRKNT